MKITFIRDCPPLPQCGNTQRHDGEKVDFRPGHAQYLIDAGYCRDGWAPFKQVVDEVVTQVVDEVVSEETLYAVLSLKALKELAKANGIKGYSRMKRGTLIKRLADGTK